jgi:hypothetical protein
MSDQIVACKKCGEPKRQFYNCDACSRREREEREAARANQAAALLAAGFSEPIVTGGMFSTDFVTCLTCGAAVALTPFQEGQTHPLDLHREWHART